MARRTTIREDVIRASVPLFERQGFHGTTLSAVLAASGAPRGSFYFHFPGGKEELALEVVARSAAKVDHLLERAVRTAGTAEHVVAVFCESLADWLERTGFEEWCAVASFAAGTSAASPALAAACARSYQHWAQILAAGLHARGVPQQRATSWAELLVAAMEGAVLHARAVGHAAPVRNLSGLLRTTVGR